jgi:isochorismate hydrolase
MRNFAGIIAVLFHFAITAGADIKISTPPVAELSGAQRLLNYHKVDPICSSSNKNAALMIVDMQGYFMKRTGLKSAENQAIIGKLIQEQLLVIQKAMDSNLPIIFLEYDCSLCDPTSNLLKMVVAKYKNVQFFKKSTDGVFEKNNVYKSELVNYLNSMQIGTLIIAGANGGSCVIKSISGALEHNCSVITYNNTIADFNYKNFIYPYVGHFTDIQPKCQDCSFKQVTNIQSLSEYMVNYDLGPSTGHAKSSREGFKK